MAPQNDDDLSGQYLLDKYGPTGVPAEGVEGPMPPEVYLEIGRPAQPGGMMGSGGPGTTVQTAPPSAASPATEPLASGRVGAPLMEQPPFTLERLTGPQAPPPDPAAAQTLTPPPPALRPRPAPVPMEPLSDAVSRHPQPIPQPVVPSGYRGTEVLPTPVEPQHSTAADISNFLYGIGLHGIRPVHPVASLLEGIYGPDLSRDPVLSGVANVLDSALTAINIPVTGIGDLTNLLFSPIVVGLRAAGLPEDQVQGVVENFRLVPELAAGFQVGAGAAGAGGVKGALGGLSKAATPEVAQLAATVAEGVRSMRTIGRDVRTSELGAVRLGKGKAKEQRLPPIRPIPPEEMLTPEAIHEKTPQAAAEIADLHNANGGATYHLRDGSKAGHDAYAVAVFPERHQAIPGPHVTPAQIEQYITQNADLLTDPRLAVGTYFDKANNVTDLDLSVAVQDRAYSEHLGKRFNQKAIYDLKRMEDINTGGTGTMPPGLPDPAGRLAILDEVLRVQNLMRKPGVKLPRLYNAAEEFRKGEYGAKFYHGVLDEMIAQVGPEHAELALKFQAAAAAGTKPHAQVALGLEAFKRKLLGQPIDDSIFESVRLKPGTGKREGELLAYEIDPKVRPNLLKQLQQVYDGGDPTGPKLVPYWRSMLGHLYEYTVDRWEWRRRYGKDQGTEAQRALIVDAGRNEAASLAREGIFSPPRDYQAASWFVDRGGTDTSLKDIIREMIQVKRRYDPEFAKLKLPGFKDSQSGIGDVETTFFMARVVLGAAGGYATGKTWDEKVRNTLIGMGVGALASPALIKKLAKSAQEYSSEYQAKKLQVQLEGRDPLGPVSPADALLVKTLDATDAERAAFLKATGEVLPDPTALGPTAPRPTGPVQINWAALRDPASVDAAVEAIAKLRPAPAEVIPQDVSRAAARELGLTSQQMLRMEQSAGGETARVQAMKDLVQAARDRAMSMADRLDAMVPGSPGYAELDAEFRQHLGLFAALTQKLLGRASEMGRAFNMLKGLPQEIGDTAAITAMAGKDLSAIPTPVLVSQVKALPPQAQVSYLSKLMEAAHLTVQTANWAFMNARLSTIEGASANTLVNLAMVAESPLLDMVAAGIGTVRQNIQRAMGNTGQIDRIYWGQPFARVIGNALAIPEALVGAWEVAKGNESTFGGIAKETPHFRPTGEYIGIKTDSPMGAALRVVTTLAELPNRLLLMAPDEFAKVMQYRGEVWSQAYQMVEREFGGRWFAPLRDLESTQTFKKGGVGSDGEILTRAVTARERFLDIIREPEKAQKQMATSRTESVSDLARDVANTKTFNQPLTGRMGAMSEALSHPLVRMTAVPFFKVPVNIALAVGERAGLQFLPVVGQLAAKAQENVAAGGAARDLEIAKLTVGAALVWWAVKRGLTGEIHGGGSTDPDLAALEEMNGQQKYSWNIGGHSFGFNRFDVFGQLVGAAADYVQLRPHMRDDEAESIAAAVVLAASRNVLSKTYMQGLADALKTVMEQRPQDLGKNPILRNLVRSFVPSGVAQVEKFMDPAYRDVYTLLDEIKARTPGWSSTLKPRLEWLKGEPQLAPQGWSPDWLPGFVSVLSPIKVTDLKNDPVINALLEDQTSIGRPPAYIDGSDPNAMVPPDPRQGIPLSAEQRYQYTRLAAKLKIDGQTQYDALLEIVQNKSDYTTGPTGSRRDAMAKVVSNYRKAAKGLLLKRFPDLRQAFVTKINDLSVAKGGPSAAMSQDEQKQLLEDLAE